jgi:hypothetical protein
MRFDLIWVILTKLLLRYLKTDEGGPLKRNYKLSIQGFLHMYFIRYNIISAAETALLYAIRINQNV